METVITRLLSFILTVIATREQSGELTKRFGKYTADMSKLRMAINYKSLESELEETVKADELYKLRNDAKLRAMEQNVPTYEHFRQIVNAAHLKPVERRDAESKAKTCWNHAANAESRRC
ncbi:coiled-coil domain-containing protein 103 [Ceratina calcarata]|uniref:Coiled-coil domain-containing protein 103 n=1 Tax=Ceratina calcarata TaxID=156304 RepID=A0AAJ7JIF1_9HYME|nr:coiled-coil domain-containing protein 103 [Ceratina calcarata]